MPNNQSAYAQAGVDIEAGNRSVELIKSAAQATHGPEVLAGIGSFGGLFSATVLKEMKYPVLVASTDGVGTKLRIAIETGKPMFRHDFELRVTGEKPTRAQGAVITLLTAAEAAMKEQLAQTTIADLIVVLNE